MANGIAYTVFVLPVIISIAFGTFVMYGILEEPDRDLNMWRFELISTPEVDSKSIIEIHGLEKEYDTDSPINLQVDVKDAIFDCGDLYVTLLEVKGNSRDVVTQSGYFDQCFSNDDLLLPIDDEFSETINSPGKYEVVVEVNDKAQQKQASSKASIIVK